jgi:acetylornithine/N-succinyldiaminopimelate aminotransferase
MNSGARSIRSCYGDQGGTFNGNAFATAVGCAVLEEIAKPGFLAGVAEAGAHLAKRLTELSQQYKYGEVRGRGFRRWSDWRCSAGF